MTRDFRVKEAYMLFHDENTGETIEWKLKPYDFTNTEKNNCELCDGTGILSIDDPNIHMTLTPCDCTKEDSLKVDLNNFEDY